MRASMAWLVAAWLSGCGGLIGLRSDYYEDVDAGPTVEAGSDTPNATDTGADADSGPRCDPNAPFGSPVALTSFNTTADEIGGTISADGKRFYFSRQTPGNAGCQIYMAAMNNGSPTLPATLVASLSNPDAAPTNDFSAVESPDGLRIYFYAYRPEATPNYGGVFLANRLKIGDPWDPPVLFLDGYVTGGGAVYAIPGWLYEPYSFYLFRLSVDTGGNIGLPEIVDDGGSGINVPVDKAVQEVAVTPDELHLYFSSFRSAPYQLHIWSSHRPSTKAPWGQPAMLPYPINTDVGPTGYSNDEPWSISPDNCTLYFSSGRTGNLDLYKVSR